MLKSFCTVLLCLVSLPAAAGGICVESQGDFVGSFLLREATLTEAAVAAEKVKAEDQFALKQTAERMADAACNADAGIASSVGVYAYLDGTAVEVESLRLDEVLKSKKTLLATVKAFAVGVRDGDTVIVRLFPVRAGGDRIPRVVAEVKPGAEPAFIKCSDGACK